MPGGKPLRLGPFIGGLNTGSDISAIADAELTECVNFELDIDGSLVSRPPFVELEGGSTWTERIVLLCEGIFSGNHYIIGSNANGVFQYLNGTWSLITSSIRSTCAVQYANKIYIVAHPSSPNPGGKWDPTNGFTAVAAIPKGMACAIHKERLFVVPGIDATTNNTRLTFSDPGNFDSWPGTNFVDVGQGDGTALKDLTVYQDNLLLFKDQSTHVFSYDIRPTDAIVRKISPTIGAQAQNCIVNYENSVYVFYNGWIYEIVNYDFHRLNTKVPFIVDPTTPSSFSAEAVCLSRLADRLVLRYYNKTYIYGLKTRTFSEWSSAKSILHYFGPILTIHGVSGDTYFAGASVTAYRSLIQLFDEQTSLVQEKTQSPSVDLVDSFTRTVAAGGWNSADTGQAWTVSSSPNFVPADFRVDGAGGRISHGTRNIVREIKMLGTNYGDCEIYWEGASPVVATGTSPASTSLDITFRATDINNCYVARMDFGLAGAANLQLFKVVAGAPSQLGSNVALTTQAAGDVYAMRIRCQGTTIKIKCWKKSAQEPNGWSINLTDTSFSTGNIGADSTVAANNTNTLPIETTHDNIQIGPLSKQVADINCHIRTKNFDMAVSNQFKRLWWWGADVSTGRDIEGIATPVVLSFVTTWDMMAQKTWDDFKTWDQPLTELTIVDTLVASTAGTARRFVKFLKALRYRQINFQINLKTDGSTIDGPAKLFTMMIVTETKQGVSKSVS